MMRCLAIDDERLVLDLLVDNIRQVPFLQLVKACKNAMEAAAVLQEDKIDLIFLDIQMPRLSGLQFLQTLTNPPLVILVTAYEQYALEGYNFNVVDYLMKPVSFERFLKACNKAYELFSLKNASAGNRPSDPLTSLTASSATQASAPPSSPTSPSSPSPLPGIPELRSAPTETADFIFVNVEYTLVKIMLEDILFIESLKDYIRIHLASSSRPVITKMSLKTMEEKLPPSLFVRIHKSYIISIRHISVIKRDLVCIGNEELPLSESYKDNLQKIIRHS